MRDIKYIVVHCTATPQNTSISSIQKYWREVLGWRNPGYHIIIKPSGEAVELLSIDKISNGVAGFNGVCINISYIGGVDAKGKGLDNRTEAQKQTLLTLLKKYKSLFPQAQIKGHREFPNVKKECPSFNASKEYSCIK